MSISITSTPSSPAFAGCQNLFEIRTAGTDIPGTKAKITFVIDDTLAHPGDIVWVLVDTLTLGYLFDTASEPIDDPSFGPSYRVTSARDLFNKLYASRHLADYSLSVAVDGPRLRVTIEALASGRHQLSVSSPAGILSIVGISTPGSDTRPLPNYRVAVRYRIGDSTLTPWVYLVPVEGIVSVDTSMLQPYLPRPEIHLLAGSLAPQPISSGITYRLQAAEVYGQNPATQSFIETDPYTLYPGEIADSSALQMLPDWDDALPNADLRSRIAVIGSAHNATISLFASQLDYLYLSSFGETRTLKISVELFSSDGKSSPRTLSARLMPSALYAIPVSRALLGAGHSHCTARLTLFDAAGNIIFLRTYLLHPSDHRTAQLFLADKYRLLRSFVPAQLGRQVSFQADRLFRRRRRIQSVTDRRDLYTATSAPLTTEQAEALADSLATDCAYLLLNSTPHPLHIEPASFSSFTTARNLTVITFDFWVESRQQHPLPHGIPGPLQDPAPLSDTLGYTSHDTESRDDIIY